MRTILIFHRKSFVLQGAKGKQGSVFLNRVDMSANKFTGGSRSLGGCEKQGKPAIEPSSRTLQPLRSRQRNYADHGKDEFTTACGQVGLFLRGVGRERGQR